MNNEDFQNLVIKQLQTLTDEVKNVNSEVSTLNQRVGNLENGQKRMETKVDKLDSKVNKLELRLENEVIEKIRGLYDSREVTNDKFNQIIEKLSDIDDSINYALAKIARHEIKLLANKKLP